MATRNIVPRANGEGSIGTAAKHWGAGHFDTLPNWQEYLAESTGYGIVSGCEPSISGLTVTVGAGVVHLFDGTRKELSATNITLDSADSTNPRIDIVYIDSTGTVAKVTGTAAASPSAPALPTNGISVAQVSVAAGATTGNIIAGYTKYVADVKYNHYLSSVTNAYSDVWYAVIKGKKPKLGLAQNQTNQVDDVVNISLANNADLAINGGVFDGETHTALGAVVQNGVLLKSNDLYGIDNERYILYCDNTGSLNCVPAKTTNDSALMALNPVWAITGWWPIVLNGAYVAPGEYGYHPRTFIGQNESGDIIIGTIDGSSVSSKGASMQDIYNFVISVGFTPTFLFNLDGGGSTHFCANAFKLNNYNADEDRAVQNIIYFDNIITSKSWTKALAPLGVKEKNKRRNTGEEIINTNELSYYGTDNDTLGVGIYKKTYESNGSYTATRKLKLGYNLASKSVYINAVTTSGETEALTLTDGGKLLMRGKQVYPQQMVEIVPWSTTPITSDGIDIDLSQATDCVRFILIVQTADAKNSSITIHRYNLAKSGPMDDVKAVYDNSGNLHVLSFDSKIKKISGAGAMYLKRMVGFTTY
jgi:exopolysaccharide biosynthesis protein